MKFNVIGVYRGFDKGIYVMALTAFINCSASFIFPFFVLFLTTYLGYDAAKAGILVSILSLIYIPASLVGGKLADRFGRKRIIVIGQFFMAISFILSGLILPSRYVVVLLFCAIFFDGITDPARNALEVDLAPKEQRNRMFSLIYQCVNMGMAIAPLMAGLMFYSYPQLMFFINGGAEIISVILVAFFVRESMPNIEEIENSKIEKSKERAVQGSVLSALASRPCLIMFSIGLFLVFLAYRQLSFLLPLQLVSLFNIDGPVLYGALSTLNAILVILLNPVITTFSTRFSEISNVILGSCLYFIAFIFFAFSEVKLMFIGVTVVYTCGEVLISNNEAAYRNNNTPVNFRGRFGAILPLFKTAGGACAPVLGGAILKWNQYSLVWILSAMVTLIAVCVFVILRRIENGGKK